MPETTCQLGDQPPEVLLQLEAFLEVHGQDVYWWGTSDSPNWGCHAIRLPEQEWLVMTPWLKGESGFIQVLPDSVVELMVVVEDSADDDDDDGEALVVVGR